MFDISAYQVSENAAYEHVRREMLARKDARYRDGARKAVDDDFGGRAVVLRGDDVREGPGIQGVFGGAADWPSGQVFVP